MGRFYVKGSTDFDQWCAAQTQTPEEQMNERKYFKWVFAAILHKVFLGPSGGACYHLKSMNNLISVISKNDDYILSNFQSCITFICALQLFPLQNVPDYSETLKLLEILSRIGIIQLNKCILVWSFLSRPSWCS